VFKLPRGTRDFTPEEMQRRRYTENSMMTTFQKFGYKEIQTPIFENLELFTAKSGATIIDELYSFKDKGDRELALRPELTAPVMRFYVDKLQMEPKPLKLFYFGNCFRYDRPQKGRYREFWQMGCELIGASTPEAMAELIALAYHAIKETGLKNINLRVGNLGYLNQQVEETLSSSNCYTTGSTELKNNTKSEIFRLIDKEDYEGVRNKFKGSGVIDKKIIKFMDSIDANNIEDLKKFSVKPGLEQELERYNKTINLLKKFGVDNARMEMKIARGLDYYSGIVFEIDAPILGAEKQLCGGGEYKLVPLFGGKETPTAGFAIGFDRTILALESEDFTFPKETVDVCVIPLSNAVIDRSLEIASDLRNMGAMVDVDLMRRGVSKSLKYAASLHSKKAVLVGPKELKKNSVIIRDMDSGDQKLVEVNNVIYML
jgi:histidyl-tRNA synthetase